MTYFQAIRVFESTSFWQNGQTKGWPHSEPRGSFGTLSFLLASPLALLKKEECEATEAALSDMVRNELPSAESLKTETGWKRDLAP